MTIERKEANRNPFSVYSAYVSTLKRMALESHRVADWNSRVDAALNGQGSAELRRVAPLETRRKFGAFFTAFAKTIIEHVKPQLVLFSIGRGHFSTPRPEIINEIRSHGASCHIRCTQLSEHCQKENLDRPASHLTALPALGRSGNQCCGGSVEIIFAGKNTVAQLDQSRHVEFVKGSVSTPLCRG